MDTRFQQGLTPGFHPDRTEFFIQIHAGLGGRTVQTIPEIFFGKESKLYGSPVCGMEQLICFLYSEYYFFGLIRVPKHTVRNGFIQSCAEIVREPCSGITGIIGHNIPVFQHTVHCGNAGVGTVYSVGEHSSLPVPFSGLCIPFHGFGAASQQIEYLSAFGTPVPQSQ